MDTIIRSKVVDAPTPSNPVAQLIEQVILTDDLKIVRVDRSLDMQILDREELLDLSTSEADLLGQGLTARARRRQALGG